MNIFKKNKKAKNILVVLIVLTLAFIWIHSMMDREQSSLESGWVLKAVTPLLEIFVGRGNVTEHLVRKLAHFCEFALLGFELMFFFDCTYIRWRAYLLGLSHCLFAATVDETIQIFSGRGSQLQDVWLDTAGGGSGAAFALLLLAVCSFINGNADS